MTRLLALAYAACFLTLAFAIRAVDDGAVEQHSGTALYAAVAYAAVLFLQPRLKPAVTVGIALGFCWLVELSQLTGIPAALSARSIVARLVLGVRFDPVDLAWYPAGVLAAFALHQIVQARMKRA